MRMVAITGSTGFVGTNLNSYLANAGYEIRAIDRKMLGHLSPETLENCDSVIHLAGKAHDLKNVTNRDAYIEVNYVLTKQLYDAFLVSNASKFIFISSVKAVADVVKSVLTEEDLPMPQTAYGKSKLMAEQYIESQPLPKGKSYYILRPCMIHGPGNKGNLNLLYQVVKKGIPYPLAAFHNKRSFLSVENLCFVIKELLVSNINNGIYQVADDDALSTNEVVKILSSALYKKAKLWAIPAGFIKIIAKLGDRLHLQLNTESLNKLTENYVVSNQKITLALNKKLPVAAAEGLQLTAKSFA